MTEAAMISAGRIARRWAGAGLVLALAAGCTPTPTPVPTATTPTAGATPTAEATPSPTATPSAPGQAPEPPESVGEPRVLAADLDVPWDLAVLPDASVLVTLRDRAEVVRVVEGESPVRVATIEDAVPQGEGGLLGLTLSPDFANDGFLYLYLSAERDNRVLRYHYDDGRLSSPQVVLDGIPRSSNHNGGRLRFGPDGMLYIGTGDAGSGRDSQDRDSLAGKILRITADGEVPGDNPFGNEVWSYGHRNVQGFGWDSQGRMFASEFGNNRLDELNLITMGGNYGWPEAEGPADNSEFIDPLLTWGTSEASPSGIAVTPNGTVFLASLRGERLWRTQWADDAMSEPEVYFDGVGRLRAAELVAGEVWVLTNNTSRGDPAPDDDRLLVLQGR